MNYAMQIVFTFASWFFAICSVGTGDQKTGWRCAALSAVFTIAVVALAVAATVVRGG